MELQNDIRAQLDMLIALMNCSEHSPIPGDFLSRAITWLCFLINQFFQSFIACIDSFNQSDWKHWYFG